MSSLQSIAMSYVVVAVTTAFTKKIPTSPTPFGRTFWLKWIKWSVAVSSSKVRDAN